MAKTARNIGLGIGAAALAFFGLPALIGLFGGGAAAGGLGGLGGLGAAGTAGVGTAAGTIGATGAGTAGGGLLAALGGSGGGGILSALGGSGAAKGGITGAQRFGAFTNAFGALSDIPGPMPLGEVPPFVPQQRPQIPPALFAELLRPRQVNNFGLLGRTL